MDIITLLISLATIIHWDMRARNIPIWHFGQCPPQWRACTLAKAVSIILTCK